MSMIFNFELADSCCKFTYDQVVPPVQGMLIQIKTGQGCTVELSIA